MVRVPVVTSQTRTTSGSRRYILLSSFENFGSSLRGMPLRPSFLASRWTATKMPVKYSTAGRMARSATSA